MSDDVHNRNYERQITDAMNRRNAVADDLVQLEFPVMNEEKFKAYVHDKIQEASGDPRLTALDVEVLCGVFMLRHAKLFGTEIEYKAGEASQ